MGNLDYDAAQFIERINNTIGVIEENVVDEALSVWSEKVMRMGIMPESMSMGILFKDGSFCIVALNGIFSLAPQDVLSYLVDEGERAIASFAEQQERIREKANADSGVGGSGK